METQNAIKLIKELKANKFLPKYNVSNSTLEDFVLLIFKMRGKYLNLDILGPRDAGSVPGDPKRVP